jgi:hypothetical protein
VIDARELHSVIAGAAADGCVVAAPLLEHLSLLTTMMVGQKCADTVRQDPHAEAHAGGH